MSSPEIAVALLRGINVGGKNKLPMKELAEIFAKTDCVKVRTYIQSGNVIFSAPAPLLKEVPERVKEQIRKRFGYTIPVIVRTSRQMAEAIRDNPFLQADPSGRSLYVYFLADLPSELAIKKLDPHRSTPDRFQVLNRHIYLHLPNGMGRTKLTNAYFDSTLSTVCTARNWATVLALFEMMQSKSE